MIVICVVALGNIAADTVRIGAYPKAFRGVEQMCYLSMRCNVSNQLELLFFRDQFIDFFFKADDDIAVIVFTQGNIS